MFRQVDLKILRKENNMGKNVAARIMDAVINNCHNYGIEYDIPIDPVVGTEGLILNYIFSEQDVEKRNKVVCLLLDQNDRDITKLIWQFFPLNIKNYNHCTQLENFAKKRENVLEKAFDRLGNIFNMTPDIPFERGVIIPAYYEHKGHVVDAFLREEPDKGFDIKSIMDGVNGGNCNGKKELSFAIIMKEDEMMVGYIKMTMADFLSKDGNTDTYNLEYYTFPGLRHNGYMKDALKAFVRAISESRIQYATENPVLDPSAKVVPLSLKTLNAFIKTDNILSLKTIESIGGFEKQGIVKQTVDYDDGHGCVIEDAFCYTRVF